MILRVISRALAVAALLGGCSETYPAYPVVPPPLAEWVPAPPHAKEALAWRPGYYDWRKGRYVWTPGKWLPQRGHGTMWQDGYWRRTGFDTYAWSPPGWR